MRDFDIRCHLFSTLFKEYLTDSETKVCNELKICCGKAVADIAVVNGVMHGYEIKSGRDTLNRLPSQIESYNRTFDFMTLVVESNHLQHAVKIIPDWWGVIQVSEERKRVAHRQIRKSRLNTGVELFSLAQLLWKEEALSIIDELEIPGSWKSKRRWLLWEELARALDRSELGKQVRNTIKNRIDYKEVNPALLQNGG